MASSQEAWEEVEAAFLEVFQRHVRSPETGVDSEDAAVADALHDAEDGLYAVYTRARSADRKQLAEAIEALEFSIPDRAETERHPYVKADVAMAIESVRAAVLHIISESPDGE